MHTGHCGCGAVTYAMNADPIIVHCCHCSECQRQTGSAFVLNALVESEHVTVEGSTHEVTLPTPSGNGQAITRCAECGVAVFSSYLIRKGRLRYIRVGTLDDPNACPPDVHIFTSSKQEWLSLEGDIPVFEEFYNPARDMPSGAFTRWKAMFGG